MGVLQIIYILKFQDGRVATYPIQIDREQLYYIPKDHCATPEWAKIRNDLCSKCGAKSDQGFCPLLPNLHELVQNFAGIKSYEKVEVEVQTEERNYKKDTDVQTALISIFGLIMAASDCPETSFFRPLVKFHLPFATTEETLFRIISMYLLAQYFRGEHQIGFERTFQHLKDDYQRVGEVNRLILEKIRQVVQEDADKNALVGLELFVQSFAFEYDGKLDSLAYLFGKRSPSNSENV